MFALNQKQRKKFAVKFFKYLIESVPVVLRDLDVLRGDRSRSV